VRHGVGVIPVIAVQEANQIATYFIERKVPCAVDTASSLLMDELNLHIELIGVRTRLGFLNHLQGSIRGATVHEYVFAWQRRLGKERIEWFFEA
jgi:hypothetical protein